MYRQRLRAIREQRAIRRLERHLAADSPHLAGLFARWAASERQRPGGPAASCPARWAWLGRRPPIAREAAITRAPTNRLTST